MPQSMHSAPSFPIISAAGRVMLRPLQSDDLPVLLSYRNDPAVSRYQSWSDYSLAQARQLLNPPPFNQDDSWFQLGIVRVADNRLLGDLGIHFIDEGRQAQLGITLDSAAQGQGFAREALTTLIRLLFETYDKHRLSAIADVRNQSSRQLFGRLGFRQEALHLQCSWLKQEWCDEVTFALLHEEWRTRGDS